MSHEGHQYEWNQWRDMIRKCYHPAAKYYSKYGGRGIGVCQPWKESFDNFLKDMGHAAPGAVLRRKETGQGFRPDNVFWGAINGGDS